MAASPTPAQPDTPELVWLCAVLPPDAELAATHETLKHLALDIAALERGASATEAGEAERQLIACRKERERLLRCLLTRVRVLALDTPVSDGGTAARRRLAGEIAACWLDGRPLPPPPASTSANTSDGTEER